MNELFTPLVSRGPARRMGWGVWLLLVPLLEPQSACTSHECKTIECSTPGVTARFYLPAASTQGQVEMCVGAGLSMNCGTRKVSWDMVLASIEKAKMTGPPAEPSFPDQPCDDAPGPSLNFACVAETNLATLAPELYVSICFINLDPALDGAPVEIVFRSTDGQVLSDAQATMHLGKLDDPAGPGCGPPCDAVQLSDVQSTGLPAKFESF